MKANIYAEEMIDRRYRDRPLAKRQNRNRTGMTDREIARALGISRTWVQAIVRRALAKLRDPGVKFASQRGRCSICRAPDHNRASCDRRSI